MSPYATLLDVAHSKEIERARFLQNHHHLIAPRLYHPIARARLDRLLFEAAWHRASPQNPA